MPIKLISIIGGSILTTMLLFSAGYKAGKNSSDNIYLRQLSSITGQLKQQQLATQEANMKLSKALNDKHIVTQIKYKTLYKDRIKYVKANPNIIVNVPIWWMFYFDAAFSNTDLSNAGSANRITTTLTTIGIDRIADTVVNNIELYYDCKDRYEAWQEWYMDNYKLRNK